MGEHSHNNPSGLPRWLMPPVICAAAIAAILTLPGLVHGQFASHEILTVEFLNGSLCFLVTGISHEAEAP